MKEITSETMRPGQVIITDRYSALGIDRPNVKTMCEGQCEGTGYIPHYKGDSELQMERQPGDDVLDELWEVAHAKNHEYQEIVDSIKFF